MVIDLPPRGERHSARPFVDDDAHGERRRVHGIRSGATRATDFQIVERELEDRHDLAVDAVLSRPTARQLGSGLLSWRAPFGEAPDMTPPPDEVDEERGPARVLAPAR